MKQPFLLLIAICLIGGTHSFAQSTFKEKLSFGAKAGINAAYFGVDKDYRNSIKEDGGGILPIISFQIGGFADYALKDNISIQAGLNLNGKGYRELSSDDFFGEQEDGIYTERVLYLEIPVNVVFKTGKLFFGAGPYAGYALSGTYKTTIKTYDDSGDLKETENYSGKIDFPNYSDYEFNRLDVGVNLLAGYQITNQLSAGLGFGMGLTNLYKDATNGAYLKNRVFSVTVGYLFKK